MSGGSHARHAFTVVELLICIAIAGVLISLMLMSVQMAREATRRSQCALRLRQLGLAVLQYESAYKVFPPGLSRGASLHVSLLPFLEQQDLFDRLEARHAVGNFDTDPDLPDIAVFKCPADSASRFCTNYAGTSGTWWWSKGWDGLFIYWQPYAYKDSVGPVRAADVTDGLSNTIGISELLAANGSMDRLRVRWDVPVFYEDIDALAGRCQSIPPSPMTYGWRGNPRVRGCPWTDGNIGHTLYNHVLPPNQPSCKNRDLAAGAYTAASHHNHGVNVTFADGHTQFISDGIDVQVWRSGASRHGGDAF